MNVLAAGGPCSVHPMYAFRRSFAASSIPGTVVPSNNIVHSVPRGLAGVVRPTRVGRDRSEAVRLWSAVGGLASDARTSAVIHATSTPIGVGGRFDLRVPGRYDTIDPPPQGGRVWEPKRA